MPTLEIPRCFVAHPPFRQHGRFVGLASGSLGLMLCFGFSLAQAQGISPQASVESAGEPPEALTQRSVIEDEGSRIEELRVRGQVRRITVTTKGNVPARYEILPAEASASESSKVSAGKRVWTLLSF